METKDTTPVIHCQHELLYMPKISAYRSVMEAKDNLGARLKFARNVRRMKQDHIAKIVGCSQARLSALETRNSEATTLLFALSRALNVNPEWLLTGEGESGLSYGSTVFDDNWEQITKIFPKLSENSRGKLRAYAEGLLDFDGSSNYLPEVSKPTQPERNDANEKSYRSSGRGMRQRHS